MEFLSELETIEKSLFHGINRKDTFLSKLNEITVHMTNLQIEDQEYLKLMQLYYYKYEMEDNLPGKRYCLIRMHQIHSYQKKKTLQARFPKLHFTDQAEETIKDFLLDHENLYLDLVVQFIKELLLVDTIFTIVFMAFLILILKMNFYTGFTISIFLSLMIYVVSQLYIKEPRVEIRCSKYAKHIDRTQRKFDLSLRK